MLAFRNFRKKYGSNDILRIDSLDLNLAVYWVKGVNGSGKSTLLKAVAGIIDFDGEIFLEGTVSPRKHPVHYRQRVNYSEAEPVFPPFLTGVELIDLFMKAKSAPRGQEVNFLEEMQMHTFITDSVSTYSSGMMKKLSVLLAFLGSPKIILLDEPFTTLDEQSAAILLRWIRTAHEETGVGFLISSHHEHSLANDGHDHELLISNKKVEIVSA